ncbi:hypothetical protein [Alteromonas sp. a30]|uniref:hypothetical protein n=1 Tax=Alteromonas sp. a30 TaxID=2730917 RepID=UPI002282AE1F|nr:hypothetical protein [Alteromonas sp. a30]MCY7296995.1 hypothetical protein [Alteromonas sp. a30]
MKSDTQPVAAEVVITGEIVHKDLEGGFYAIYADNNQRYMPLNLASKHKKAGLKVKLTATLQPEVRTIQMHGTPITILSIEVIGQNAHTDDPRI